MKIIGNAQFAEPPGLVYRALNDPAVLVRSIPGCERLEGLGGDAYAMTVAAGVGSIKGVYDGRVELTDHDEPGSFRLHAEGAGAAGTIAADVHVRLEPTPAGGTSVTYDADATVGGTIGGVGQRMLVGVSKRMAAEFFGNVETVLTGAPAGGDPARSGAGAPAATVPGGAVYTAAAPRARGGPSFGAGVALGASAALAGALVGAAIAGRRR